MPRPCFNTTGLGKAQHPLRQNRSKNNSKNPGQEASHTNPDRLGLRIASDRNGHAHPELFGGTRLAYTTCVRDCSATWEECNPFREIQSLKGVSERSFKDKMDLETVKSWEGEHVRASMNPFPSVQRKSKIPFLPSQRKRSICYVRT